MVLLRFEDGGGCLQVHMGPANVLNRPLRTADRLLSSSLGDRLAANKL
jgi:hypothetical protein